VVRISDLRARWRAARGERLTRRYRSYVWNRSTEFNHIIRKLITTQKGVISKNVWNVSCSARWHDMQAECDAQNLVGQSCLSTLQVAQ